MTNKPSLQINRKIEICFAGKEDWHKTTILDMNSHTIFVGAPTFKGKPIIPQVGDQVSGRIIAQDAVYRFDSTFLNIKVEGKVPLLMLNKPLTYIRKQRRNYYRHPVVLDIEIAVSQEDGLNPMHTANQSWIPVKSLDIGGGGIRLVSPVKLLKDKNYKVRICFGSSGNKNMDIILLTAQVTREEAFLTGHDKYIYGVTFINIVEAQRDRIINFIFNLNRRKPL
ncbi:MAG: flagellar brake domain-containing protein [Firmicutes bacterium]|nr:flagellar brake domain-containing protein [Bacillota bacterium]